MVIDKTRKPGRPFGLTLAILLSWMFFALIPSLTVVMRLVIEDFMTRPQTIILPDGSTSTSISGMDAEDRLPQDQILLQTFITASFTVVAIFAWRGHPKGMRFVLMLTVLGIAGILIAQTLAVMHSSQNPMEGGSAQGILTLLCNANILFLFLLPIYVVWYLNRGPARAFYRGYYLPEEAEQIEALFSDGATSTPSDTKK